MTLAITDQDGNAVDETVVLNYLDDLRRSGVTNMFGAGEYLQREFNLDRRQARAALMYWMETFGERGRQNA